MRRRGRPRNPISRDDLLARARIEFARSGYAGASMRTIAEAAGLNKASLFHHFDSKEALYIEVLARITDDLRALVLGAAVEDGDYPTRLDKLGTLVVRYMATHPESARLLMRELIDGGAKEAWPLRQPVHLTLELVSAFLAEGMKQGEIVEQDARQLAISIASLHLAYFAAAEVSSDLIGKDVFSPAATKVRIRALLAQVRRLCGIAPAGSA